MLPTDATRLKEMQVNTTCSSRTIPTGAASAPAFSVTIAGSQCKSYGEVGVGGRGKRGKRLWTPAGCSESSGVWTL